MKAGCLFMFRPIDRFRLGELSTNGINKVSRRKLGREIQPVRKNTQVDH